MKKVFRVISPTSEEKFFIISETLESAKKYSAKFILTNKYLKVNYGYYKKLTWEKLEELGWDIINLPDIVYTGKENNIIKPNLLTEVYYKI